MTAQTRPDHSSHQTSAPCRPVALSRLLSGLVVALGVLVSLATAAGAQTAAAAPAAPSSPLTQQQARQVLDMLNDPQKRAAFTHTLDAIVTQQAASAPAPAPAAAPVAAPAASAASAVVTPKTAKIGGDVRNELMVLRTTVKAHVQGFVAIFRDFAAVSRWFRTELRQPEARASLIDALWRAGVIFVIALVCERGSGLLLRRPLDALSARSIRAARPRAAAAPVPTTVSPTPDDAAAVVPAAPVDGQPGTEIERDKRAEDVRRGQDTMRFLRRVPFALGHFLLKLVPVAVCVGIGNLGVALLPQTDEAEVVGLTTVNAYVIARCLYLVVETIFAPSSPGLRLWMVSTAIARRIVRWWAVLVAAPAIIVWLTTVGSTFDMAPRGVQALIRAIVLIEHLLLAMFIWRLRGPVADGLQPSAARQKQPFWAFMAHLARIWWLPAIFLDIAFWGVWATQRHDGYRWIWQATGLTVAVLALGRLLGIALFSLQDRLFRLGGRGVETTESTPLQRRLDRYYPLARRTTNAMVVVLTAVALLQVWGVPSVAFFTGNPVGVRLLSAVVTILVAITIGIVVWEISNTMLDRRVELYSSGDAVSRAVRLRTVLPIIRTVLAVFIIIIVTVTTLSQIGINVAPLLTGAGILGAAIAFGSQSLVKDFITGFFMLVENAIQVGDVVTAAGVTGTVEHLSIRTLRLRTSAGDINIIPFSSVTSVSNQSRDYNYVTVTLTLDLGEDPDRVAALIDQVVGEMRDEPAFATRVQSGFNNLGVNSADAGGAVLIGRVRVEAGARATIERELYRRLRGLFVANAVHFPGWAPPIMRLVTEAPIDVAFTGEAPSAPPPPLPPSPTAAPSGAAPAEVPTDDAPRPAAS